MLEGAKTRELEKSGKYWQNFNAFLGRYLKTQPPQIQISYWIARGWLTVQKSSLRFSRKATGYGKAILKRSFNLFER
jgi:hypothetical protein